MENLKKRLSKLAYFALLLLVFPLFWLIARAIGSALTLLHRPEIITNQPTSTTQRNFNDFCEALLTPFLDTDLPKERAEANEKLLAMGISPKIIHFSRRIVAIIFPMEPGADNWIGFDARDFYSRFYLCIISDAVCAVWIATLLKFYQKSELWPLALAFGGALVAIDMLAFLSIRLVFLRAQKSSLRP